MLEFADSIEVDAWQFVVILLPGLSDVRMELNGRPPPRVREDVASDTILGRYRGKLQAVEALDVEQRVRKERVVVVVWRKASYSVYAILGYSQSLYYAISINVTEVLR